MAKRLYRNKKNSVIAGVCSGFGEYFEVDPTLIRILWLLLFFTGGIGLLAYIIAWIVVPTKSELKSSQEGEEYLNEVDAVDEKQRKRSSKLVGGVILVVLGILLLFDQEWYFAQFLSTLIKIIAEYFVPLILIGVGIYFITKGKKESKNNEQNNNEENKE